VTAAVDSAETVEAAARAGVLECLVDVNVGLPRCGCDPADAGRIADLARAKGMEVRGVMGYEGHLMRETTGKGEKVEAAGELLLRALADVGGDVVSGGGTGTWTTNEWATELQAGSYCLMDTEYVAHAPEFPIALSLLCTVVSATDAWGVADGGLKALGMDHGDPTVVDVGDCWFVSDEHTTFGWKDGHRLRPGDRVRLLPAHVDPTVAMHERLHVVDGDEVVDVWEVDLRGW
jgi:D-serine deaminase-like pyridoxal phosphate-dependent protein